MVALAVVAMLWGNCLSCPDMFAAMTSHQADHSCCHKPQPASVKCHTQGMQHFVQAETHTVGAPAVAELAEPVAPAALPEQWAHTPLAAERALPDRIPLLVTLRI